LEKCENNFIENVKFVSQDKIQVTGAEYQQLNSKDAAIAGVDKLNGCAGIEGLGVMLP
jgi:hypothetical protein